MKKLNIALVAHDARKKELIDWIKFNKQSLYNHHIIATGTTGKLLGNIMVKQVAETDWKGNEYFVNKYLPSLSFVANSVSERASSNAKTTFF